MATQLASATDQLWDRWPYLSHEQRLKHFRELHTGEKADFFLAVDAHDQYNLLLGLPEDQRQQGPKPTSSGQTAAVFGSSHGRWIFSGIRYGALTRNPFT
jgi:hypothetical protein